MLAYYMGQSLLYKHIKVPLLGRQDYNPLFWQTYYQSLESSKWTHEKLQEFQLNELKKVIDFAYKNTKFYKKLFDESGINPGSFNHLEDIKKIPLLYKEDLINYIEQIKGLPKQKIEVITTGGSTGKPTKIFLEKDVTRMRTYGYVVRSYNEAGYFLGDKIATIRGDVLKNGKVKYIRENNELAMSSFYLGEENINLYLKEIEKFSPKYLRAYPSSAEILAKYIQDNNLNFNESGKIKALFTSSENLTGRQKSIIEKSLNVKIYDHYGNAEQNVMITQCKYGNYHEYMEYSYVEYLDRNNNVVEEGEARVVGTNFGNRAMPLIRYDTGDRVFINKNQKCRCGKQHNVVKKIAGRHREDEILIGKYGNKIPLTAVNSHSDVFDHVYRTQYVQEECGKVLLRVQPRAGYSEKDHTRIQREFQNRLGESVQLVVCETEQLETTLRGKSKLLIQRINL